MNGARQLFPVMGLALGVAFGSASMAGNVVSDYARLPAVAPVRVTFAGPLHG